MVNCTSLDGLVDTATVLTLKNLLHARKHYFTMGYRWIEVITFFLRNISKAPAHQSPSLTGALKMALKWKKYENHFDCTVTSLINWQAIIITDQPGNTVDSRVVCF